MKNMTLKTLTVLCIIGALAGLSIGSAIVILSTSNPITVINSPPPTFTTTLTINGTSATQYVGAVHPNDKLVLVATSTSSPSGFVSGKTTTFFSNSTTQIGTQIVNGGGVATLTWTMPTLVSSPNNDTYIFRAELT